MEDDKTADTAAHEEEIAVTSGTGAGSTAGADGALGGGGSAVAGDSGGAALPKTTHEKQAAAREFAERWAGSGKREIADTQIFWGELLRNVFGVSDLKSIIQFEKPVWVDGQSLRIDGFITLSSLMGTSRILIEQKNRNVYLGNKEKQSDGSLLTPFEQGKRYADWLGEESPR